MNIHRNATFALFALALLAVGVPLAAAQGNGIEYQYSAGIVTLETDDIAIKVTGYEQSPHFHWWDPDNPTVDYHVMFVKLFEANDTNQNGVFDNGVDTLVGAPFALPTANWDFSGFSLEEVEGNVTAVHFNFTNTAEHDPRPDGMGYGDLPVLAPFDLYMEVRVHISLENPGEMKFDLVIDGWEWTFDDSILVLMFTVTESNHGQVMGDRDPGSFHRTGTKFQFSNGYFQYNETALAAENQLEVKASYGEGEGLEAGEAIYLAFEYFGNETLVYDPILGVGAAGLALDPLTLAVVGGVAIIVVLAAVVIKRR